MTPLKIIVLGANGMLGHQVVLALREKGHNVTAITRETFDATNPAIPFPADVVVNCIGLVKQRPEADDIYLNVAINANLPHRLQRICESDGARLIHISTDCVFSGRKGSYRETSESDATDLYGKSKYLGEVIADNTLTLRTSFIGPELQNHFGLLDWFLAQKYKQVKGYKLVKWSGVSSPWLAATISELIYNHPTLSGLYQVTCDAPITKYDLLCLLVSTFKWPVGIVHDYMIACDRSMIGDKFTDATGIVAPSWADMAKVLAKGYL